MSEAFVVAGGGGLLIALRGQKAVDVFFG